MFGEIVAALLGTSKEIAVKFGKDLSLTVR
jgi:hypothetical protein